MTLTAEQTDPANAETDARAALARGDRHLWAGYTFNVYVYGAPYGEIPKDWTGGVLFIRGMTDVIKSDEHRRFMDQTDKYAVAYNHVILASTP